MLAENSHSPKITIWIQISVLACPRYITAIYNLDPTSTFRNRAVLLTHLSHLILLLQLELPRPNLHHHHHYHRSPPTITTTHHPSPTSSHHPLPHLPPPPASPAHENDPRSHPPPLHARRPIPWRLLLPLAPARSRAVGPFQNALGPRRMRLLLSHHPHAPAHVRNGGRLRPPEHVGRIRGGWRLHVARVRPVQQGGSRLGNSPV